MDCRLNETIFNISFLIEHCYIKPTDLSRIFRELTHVFLVQESQNFNSSLVEKTVGISFHF